MSTKRILIAEDYIDNYILLKVQLKDYPYELFLVKNGQEALNIIEKEKFDLYLIDIQMPILNGFDFIKKIREKGNNTPAIAQTAHAYETDYKECLKAGFNDYISKPIDKYKLIEKLNAYLK